MTQGQPRIEDGDDLDFRDEIYAHIFDRGDPRPKRTLRFDIFTSNRGRAKGFSAFRRVVVENWQKIGEITFDNCVASYKPTLTAATDMIAICYGRSMRYGCWPKHPCTHRVK